MTFLRSLLTVSLAASCSGQGKFELQPFAGIRFGGTLRNGDNDPSPIVLQTGAAAGASITYNPMPAVGLELMWTTQQVKGKAPTATSTLRMNQYLGNLVFNIRQINKEAQGFIPFFLVGVGAAHVGAGSEGSVKFSYALGGGFRQYFSKHIGWRVQARYAPIYLYSTPLQNPQPCYSPRYSYECQVNKQHDANQGDVTAGFVFRF